MNIEIVQLLEEAKHEIINLRQKIEVLQSKVDVLAIFERALLGEPRQMGASVDVAWLLSKKIVEISSQQPVSADAQPGKQTTN